MKAAVFYGTKDLRVTDIPVPAIGDDDILVRVKACGICGTDLHIYEGAQGAAACTPPTVLGHEFSGVIEKAGRNVVDVKPGDRVVIDPNDLCDKCTFCKTGRGHFCEHMTGIGTTVNGGFAEYCAVRAKQAYKIPDSLSFEEAALSEPISCCLHGIDLAEIRPGSSVMVIGGGPIGLIMLQLARLAGAATVLLLEPVEEKRAIAKVLGADITIDPIREDVRETLAKNGIDNLDAVIECVGLKSTMRDAIEFAGKCSTVVLFGLTAPDCEIAIRPFDIFKKEVKITASYINPYTMSRAIAVLMSRRVDVKSIIGRTLPLDEICGPFEDVQMRRNGKVIVKL
jgi:2-desacetyl-2-hydroxyethyl bacteriochlorophyllide A dehydrogenase